LTARSKATAPYLWIDATYLKVRQAGRIVSVAVISARSSDAPTSSASFPTRKPSPAWSGAILLEQNDEWAVQRARYMTLETIASLSDDPIVLLPAVAA
jgi:hypothetical protein